VPYQAEAAARRPNGLWYFRYSIWVHFRFLGDFFPAPPSWCHQLSNSPNPTTILSRHSSHSSLLLPKTMSFAPQNRAVQCKNGLIHDRPSLPFLVASSRPRLLPFPLLKRPHSPRLPLLSPLIPITRKCYSHQPLSPDITVLFYHGWQTSLNT